MSTHLPIRQSSIDDLPRLKEIIAASFPWFFRYFAAESVSDLDEPTIVYEADGVIVGFAKLTQFKIQQVKYGCILWIAVEPQHQRRGIAQTLTTAALEWQQSHGAKAVFASTQRNNRAALATLGKAGFVRLGFGALRRLFGWHMAKFFGDIWLAPGEVVLAHF